MEGKYISKAQWTQEHVHVQVQVERKIRTRRTHPSCLIMCISEPIMLVLPAASEHFTNP